MIQLTLEWCISPERFKMRQFVVFAPPGGILQKQISKVSKYNMPVPLDSPSSK